MRAKEGGGGGKRVGGTWETRRVWGGDVGVGDGKDGGGKKKGGGVG